MTRATAFDINRGVFIDAGKTTPVIPRLQTSPRRRYAGFVVDYERIAALSLLDRA